MVKFSPDESQAAVINSRERLCVLAGAGSGKTGTLVAALIGRLEDSLTAEAGPRLEITDILALTFTEKAAAELRRRLARSFSERASLAPETAGYWRDQAARLDRADIGTIHSYALKLVRENALTLGLTTTPKLDDDDRALSLDLSQLLTDWLDQGDSDLLSLLEHYPLRVLTALLEKCARRLSAWGLAGLTADLNKTEENYPDRLLNFKKIADTGLELVRHGDLNQAKPYYAKVLTAMEELTERLSSPVTGLVDDLPAHLADWTEILRLGGQWYSQRGKPMRQSLLAALKEIQTRLDNQAALILKEPLLRLANRLPASLAARRRQRGAINFDDILSLARRLLAGRPELRRREAARHQLVMVDEFQDTNRLQADLLAYLLLPPGDDRVYPEHYPLWFKIDWASASTGFQVFGDLKQSIYRFRGAEVEIMAGLRQSFQQGGGQVLALEGNYRSQAPLVHFFNTLFPPHLENFTDRDRQRALRPALYSGPQVVQLRSSGPCPSAGREQARAQALLLARYLAELFNGQRGVLVADASGQARPPRPGEVALLFRRFTWAGTFKDILTEAGWPCRLSDSTAPLAYAEVRGLLAAFLYLSGLDRELSLASLLRSPLGPVSDAALMALAWPEAGSRPRALSDYFRAQPPPRPWPTGLNPDDQRILSELRLLLDQLTPLYGRVKPVELLERLVEERRLLPLALLEADGDQRVRAVTACLALARTLGRARDHQPLGPAEELRNLLTNWQPGHGQVSLSAEEGLTLMTVHGAKGLEFPVVVLAEADSRPRGQSDPVVMSWDGQLAVRLGLAPDYEAISAEEKRLEALENGRLFYVAATRARDHLVFLGWPRPSREKPRAAEPDADDPAETPPSTVWLEALLANPAAAALTGVVEYEAAELEIGPGLTTPAPAATTGGAPPAPPRLLTPVPVPDLTLSVTALSHWLAELNAPQESGPEPPFFEAGPSPESEADHQRLSPVEEGNLFHAVLERIDPLAPQPENLLALQAARLGLTPGLPEIKSLAAKIEKFLVGGLGQAWLAGLAEGGCDFREQSFQLNLTRPDGGRLTLAGAIDLFFITGAGEGQIVDFKLSVCRPGRQLTAYEHQLRLYAQALIAAGFKGPLQAALYFAGGAEPVIHQVGLARFSPLEPMFELLWKNFYRLENSPLLRRPLEASPNIV